MNQTILSKVEVAEDGVDNKQIKSLNSRRQRSQQQRYNPFDSTTDKSLKTNKPTHNKQMPISSQRQSYVEVTDEELLEKITKFAKKYEKKMLRNACKRFVAVTIFLLSLNVAIVSTAMHGYDGFNFEIVSMDAKCNNNFIEKCNETIFCEKQFALRYSKESLESSNTQVLTNETLDFKKFLEQNAVSFLDCAFCINAASISIISAIASLIWRDIRIVNNWGGVGVFPTNVSTKMDV